MGEAASTTVRLVRCPKCENLLPELPDFSVYQCGGCGAVLRGTGKASLPTSEGLLRTSCDDSGAESSENAGLNLDSGSVIERESEKFDIQRTEETVIHEKTADVISSSSSQKVTREVPANSNLSMRGRSDHNKSGVKYSSSRATTLSNMNGSDIAGAGVLKEPSETRRPFGSLRSTPSRSVMDQWSLGRNGSGSFRGKGQGFLDEFGALSNLDEGPSSYCAGPFNHFNEQIKNRDDLDGVSRVKDLEKDRAELLRKLDELKDQLKRTCDVSEKPKNRLDPHNVIIPREPPYFDHYHGAVSYSNNHPLERQEYYPSHRNVPDDYLGYRGAYHPHVIGHPSHQPPHQYLPPTYNGHFQEPQMPFYADPLASRSHEAYFHQPSCSCLRCNITTRQKKIPSNVPSQLFNSRDSMYPTFDRHRDPVAYGTPGYNYRFSQERPHHMRSSSEFPTNQRRRVIVTRGGERVYHPIAGGAPFVSCCNCFELLKVSRKLLTNMLGKNQRKMKCGACSAVIMFELKNKSFVVSVPAPSKRVRSEVGAGSGGTSSKSLLGSSDNIVNPGYEFHLSESEAEKGQELSFTSPSISDDEESPDNVISRTENSLNDSELDSRYGKGNRSKRNDTEKGPTDRPIALQSSLQDASLATEMDVPLSEYNNNGADTLDMSKEEEQVKNKGSESFFAGLIKKSFRDFSRSSRSTVNRRSNVFVNGQPIPDRVVKKAEKVAGPIQPGEYWYDFQAGFWGVMNQPCLGVIPPFIEEFNYPMPENCAAGNTEVFVNGRELHQQDLELLASRGLPTTRDRSYIIEISGRVLDEDTCEELDGLGKLAPTVEREKRGFGMKVPRANAQ